MRFGGALVFVAVVAATVSPIEARARSADLGCLDQAPSAAEKAQQRAVAAAFVDFYIRDTGDVAAAAEFVSVLNAAVERCSSINGWTVSQTDGARVYEAGRLIEAATRQHPILTGEVRQRLEELAVSMDQEHWQIVTTMGLNGFFEANQPVDPYAVLDYEQAILSASLEDGLYQVSRVVSLELYARSFQKWVIESKDRFGF